MKLVTILSFVAFASALPPNTFPLQETDDITRNVNVIEKRGKCWFGEGIGCSKSGYCWQVCNKKQGTWCWMGRDGGRGAREYCGKAGNAKEHCVNVWKKGLIGCALGNCKDCGCKCW